MSQPSEYERGVDEGIDITIEVVRRHITPEQQHAIERAIAELLAQPSMESARELVRHHTEDGESHENVT